MREGAGVLPLQWDGDRVSGLRSSREEGSTLGPRLPGRGGQQSQHGAESVSPTISHNFY